MADVWRGNILLHNDTLLEGKQLPLPIHILISSPEADVVLASQNIASSPTIPAGTLRFLSAVETARIPLHLAAGPSLDVWTSSEETQAWFESVLLSQAAVPAIASGATSTRQWWTQPRSQSPIGVLVQVETQAEDSKAPKVSEILFYGTIATSTTKALPTPPSSSPEHEGPAVLPELRVYALPLSSDLLYKPSAQLDSAASKTSHRADKQEPQFIPSSFTSTRPNGSPKRKRDVFEEAAELRKKAKKKAAEDIAAAAAKAAEFNRPKTHRRSLSIDHKAPTPFPDFQSGVGAVSLARPGSRPGSRPLSRSPSITSETRPLSRMGLIDNHASKRSTLSQVATVPLHPEEPTTESRNKEALSRIVMAAMRMQGLQQRKKNRSRRGSEAPGVGSAEQLSAEAAADEAAKDEEYKLIYHQTYKGAALALVNMYAHVVS